MLVRSRACPCCAGCWAKAPTHSSAQDSVMLTLNHLRLVKRVTCFLGGPSRSFMNPRPSGRGCRKSAERGGSAEPASSVLEEAEARPYVLPALCSPGGKSLNAARMAVKRNKALDCRSRQFSSLFLQPI